MKSGPGPRSAWRTELESVATLFRRQWNSRPRIGMILGTGLGNLAAHIQPEAIVPYDSLPGFPRSTAIGHRGRFVCGRLADQPVIAMDGRIHFYEGYTAEQITRPVRLMRALGAELLIVSNASGGLNPKFQSGDILAVCGHIDWMGARIARSWHETAILCQPSGTSCYDPDLLDQALSVARREGIACHRGVYVGVLGPNFETRAEYRALRRLGGDAVGMSTIPEAIIAARIGMRVLALSMITNVARPDAPAHVDAQHVIDVAATAEPRLRNIVLGVLRSVPSTSSSLSGTRRSAPSPPLPPA